MIDSPTSYHIATFCVSQPTFAAPPALARETVYMPSSIAARVIPRTLVTEYTRRLEHLQHAPPINSNLR
jgi:hypothetical protein